MVHQYKLNGYNIILDTCSGSVHTVDEVAYDIIAMYKQATKDEIVTAILEKYGHMPDVTEEEILACIEDIAALEENGFVERRTAEEDKRIIRVYPTARAEEILPEVAEEASDTAGGSATGTADGE